MELTEDLSSRTLCRVQCRFVLGDDRSANTSKLFFVYKDKWSTLMKYVLSKKRSWIYEDLPNIRRLLNPEITVLDVLELSQDCNLDESGLQMMVDAQPLFNLAPHTLKAFILATFGLRSHHLSKINQ